MKQHPSSFNGLYLYIYRVTQKKNVPNFAQVFSRRLSRYEGDILQVY